MVLTRSLYSRSGTPLASPLNNPERPETKQRQTRKKQQVLANLSQQSDQNTASPPCSQSPSSSFLLTPITPSNPARFGLELTERLDHTKLLDQQSILTTPGQLSLQIHQQSIQSSPQPFFTPDHSYLCAKPHFELRNLDSNNFTSSQTLDTSHNPSFSCQSLLPPSFDLSSSQPQSTPTSLSQDIPPITNALGFLPHPPAASPQDLLLDLLSHKSDHTIQQQSDIQASTQILQSQPLIHDDSPCSEIEIEMDNQVAAPTETKAQTDQTKIELEHPIQIEHQIQLEHPIDCQMQQDSHKESVEADPSHSNTTLQSQPPATNHPLNTIVDQTKIEVEHPAEIVVEDQAEIETQDLTELEPSTQDLELETGDQKHPELDDPAKIETSTPPQTQPPTPLAHHHPTIETENMVEDLTEVELEYLTEVKVKIKPEGQIEATSENIQELHQTPTEHNIQLVPDQKSAHKDQPNSNKILQSQTASPHPNTQPGNDEAEHAEIVEVNQIEVEVEDQSQINQTPADLEQAEVVHQIQQDPHEDAIQGELLSRHSSQTEVDVEHQFETEEQVESRCSDKSAGPADIEVEDPTNDKTEDQAPSDQIHLELDHQPENEHPIQQNCHHEEAVQIDPPSFRSSQTEIDEEQHNETKEQAESPTSDEGSSSISDDSGADSITGETSVDDDDESGGDDDEKSDLEMDESDDEEIKEILKRAKQEAEQLDKKSNKIKAVVGDEMASSDCGSSITFGKNLIKLDEQQDGQKEQSRKANSLLSQPIKISELERATRNQKTTQSKSSLNSTKQSSLTPHPTNFDRVLAIKEQQLGLSSSSFKKIPRQSMDWHDLPVQELTKEVKMEIQAMRLHRTLDPKGFIKGGIEKATKEPIPTKFLFGYVTGGDGSLNGSTTTGSSSIKKRSFVESLLHDEKGQEWSKKKYNEVQSAGRRGKHTANNPKKPFKKRH